MLRGEFLSGDTVVMDCVNEEIVMKPLVKEALHEYAAQEEVAACFSSTSRRW